MYIIENGKPYLIENNMAYNIIFGAEGKTSVNKDDSIEYTNQQTYTYDEIVRKFNINFLTELREQKEQAKKFFAEEIKEYESKIKELEKLVKELKKENETLKKSDSKKK